MKKVLYVENDFKHGGRQKVSLDILKRLVANGEYQVDLCILNQGGDWDNLVPHEVNKVNIFDIPAEEVQNRIVEADKKYSLTYNFKNGHFLRAVKIVLQRKYRKSRARRYGDLFTHIKQGHYDFVVAANIMLPVVAAVATRVNADCRIAWVHRAFCARRDVKKFNLNPCVASEHINHDVELYPQFDKIVCVSDFVKKLFDHYFPDLQNKSVVLYNAMDIDEIRALSEQPVSDCTSARFTIATVGRVEEEKGQALAVCAADILKKQGYTFKWYFVGGGNELDKLKTEAAKLGLQDYCIFVGPKNNPYPYIKACDCYCQPSLTEAYCTTVNEARILGKAVVATRFTAIGEQITHNVDGIICDINAEALAKALTKVFDSNYLAELTKNVKYPSEIEENKIFSVDKLFK